MPWKNGNPPFYNVWRDMLRRCYDKNYTQYKDYGGRGIKVCPRWRYSYKQFYADMAPRPPGLTLDRKDNDKDYTPENCRWATRAEQQQNQRRTRKVTIEGTTYLAILLAQQYGLKCDTIVTRARLGLPFNEVISKIRRKTGTPFKAIKISSKRRRARTHCSFGHEWTEENTRWGKNGKYTFRVCKACHNRRQKERWARKRLRAAQQID
jgi:hypothetical protein